VRVTITGASGLIGTGLVQSLIARGDEVTVLTRNPDAARSARSEPTFVGWDPLGQAAPVAALEGRDAVVHLAGAPVARRWSSSVKRAIRDSRVLGTQNLVDGLGAVEKSARPAALVSASAIGYYGAHGPEPIDEEAPAGEDFLAGVCVEWEAAARVAEKLGIRAVQVRIGVVLHRSGGALAQMLTPFRLGLGGPVGSGDQYMAWIHRDDLVGIMLAALGDERWSGAVNGTAPEPVTSRTFARALGRELHRPALLPLPTFALRALFGEMAQVITSGVRAMPAKALVLDYSFEHPHLEGALRSALAGTSY
jgi:uncharacterized protein